MPPFESKYAITQYLASSSLPYALVPAGSYLSNFIGDGPSAPVKVAEGHYVFYKPVSAKTVVPILDARKDYGSYVRAVIEHPGLGIGSELLTGAPTTLEEMLNALNECEVFPIFDLWHAVFAICILTRTICGLDTGASFTFQHLTKDEWLAKHGQRGIFLYDMWHHFEEFGCKSI